MKKNKNISQNDLLPEYDFSAGIRGKYASKLAEENGFIKLEPKVAKYFKKSKDVNKLLLAIINSIPSVRKNASI